MRAGEGTSAMRLQAPRRQVLRLLLLASVAIACCSSPLVDMASAANAPGSGGTAALATPAGTPTTGASTSTLTTTTTSSAGTTSSTAAPAGSTPTTGTPARSGSSTPSKAAIALGALAAVFLLLSVAWALARFFAYEPAWMPTLRHSFAEAGFRLSATWAELGDWLRLGR